MLPLPMRMMHTKGKGSQDQGSQGLMGEVAMTMGMELRRAHVNSYIMMVAHSHPVLMMVMYIYGDGVN